MKKYSIIGILCLYILTMTVAQEKSTDQNLQKILQRLKKLEKNIKELRKENIELKKQMQGMKLRNKDNNVEQENDLEQEEKISDESIESLRSSAEEEAEREEKIKIKDEKEEGGFFSTVFKSGQQALQALNPEISITGDFISQYIRSGNENYARHVDFVEHSGVEMRTLGLHAQANLDPYSYMKVAASFHDGNFRLGEAYITFTGIFSNINITLGTFRQQFGIVNRWHLHGLDQVNFPLPLKKIFGNGGLRQSGISFEWSMPDILSGSQGLTVQITNGENERLFQGEHWSSPSILTHYKYYIDLSKSTYMELGLSGLTGPNNRQGFLENQGEDEESWRWSTVAGLDFTILWEPVEKMRYYNIVWRSEFYFLWKEQYRPSSKSETIIRSYGAYSYLQSKVSRTIEIGIRGDFYKPQHRGFEVRHLTSRQNRHLWQISPYVTWMISPFVKLRLEYNYLGGKNMEPDPREHRVYVQCIFAAGPHKHERY